VPQILVAPRDGLHTFDERRQEIAGRSTEAISIPSRGTRAASATSVRLRALVVTGAATELDV
jgi:hypothetical protein